MNRVLRLAAALVKLRTPKYIIQTSTRKFSESSAFAMPAYKGSCYCGELIYSKALFGFILSQSLLVLES